MKTAEEILEDWFELRSPETKVKMIGVIRAIQADALRHAANQCRLRQLQMFTKAHYTACNECATYIEAEAERLESAAALEKEKK